MKTLNAKLSKIFAAAVALTVAAGTVAAIPATFAQDSHVHTFSDEWSSDRVNHYREATCGDDIITDVEAHDFGSDGKCKVCGYTLPEAEHVHTYATTWTYDNVNHWHASTCGDNVIKDAAPHVFVNGVCECGFRQSDIPHTHTFSDELSYDAVNHYFEATCGHNVVLSAEAHTLKDGVCTVCGYSVEAGEFKVTYGGYSEGIYAEWDYTDGEQYSITYCAKGGTVWTPVDSELIRVNGDTVRADIVGLAAGTYNVKVTNGKNTYTANDIQVTAYDRAGYAHFGATSGVGGYNDDGTPKANAQIIYVTEATKNTVTAKLGSTTYTGIVKILSNASKTSNPLIVRIIGRVAAATWNEISYASFADGKGQITGEAVRNYSYANGKQLGKQEYTQAELIAQGFNTLDTSKYAELTGLSSKMTYDTAKDEYDSAWNNCSISGASNVTVEGIGNDAEIFQWGMTWVNCNSIEVRNITFDDYTEDACSFEGNSEQTSADAFAYKRFWIHNNTFNEGKNYWDVCNEQDKHEGDGATDFKRLSYVTVSYNHYYKNHKTGLIGASDTSMTANVTFHHNFYEDCQSRMPLARQANMHMYNNYYKGSTNTNMSLRASSVALIEYCYFENARNPVTVNDTTAVGLLWNCTVETGSQSNTSLSLVANQIVQLSSRNANNGVNNTNNKNSFGGMNFYLDSSVFYFVNDAAIKADPYFIPTAEIPEKIPVLAGALK